MMQCPASLKYLEARLWRLLVVMLCTGLSYCQAFHSTGIRSPIHQSDHSFRGQISRRCSPPTSLHTFDPSRSAELPALRSHTGMELRGSRSCSKMEIGQTRVGGGRRDKALVARWSSSSASSDGGTQTAKSDELRTLYPAGDMIEEGTLQVDDVHTLKFRVYGNPNATLTALFLHGGPGAACFPNHARFFDPQRYRIVLVDQRGCGGSTPRGSALDNDTWNLVSDLEKLREDRRVGAWDVVLGGSWGVALAVAYAEEHPARVKAMVLRGVCLMRRKEICWLFGPDGGASSLAPRGYSKFLQGVAEDRRGSCEEVLDDYLGRLYSNDTKTRDLAARAWSSWEFAVSGLNLATAKAGNESDIAGRVLEWNGTNWLVDGILEEEAERRARAQMMERFQKQKREREAQANKTESANPEPGRPSNEPSTNSTDQKANSSAAGNITATAHDSPSAPAQAMLTCLYSAKGAFMEDGLLLRAERIARIRGIPCIAVQGAADLICPPVTAYDLHMAWPEMQLRVVKGSGHSMYDPGITSELVKATDTLADMLRPTTPDT